LLAALLLCSAAACGKGGGGDRGAAPAPSDRLTIPQTLQIAYDAGFHTEDQLAAVVAIGISESSLVIKARRWHPEYGVRPVSAALGVPGPTEAWDAEHTQQVNSDRGVWQISSHWWPQYTDAQTDDPAQAAQAVWEISKHGRDFTPWDTYKAKVAQKHYTTAFDGWPAVGPLVKDFLASKR